VPGELLIQRSCFGSLDDTSLACEDDDLANTAVLDGQRHDAS